MPGTRSLLSVSEAAELVGRHPETIRTWIKEEGLDAEKVRGSSPSGYEYRIEEDDLIEFMQVEEK